jgi:nucleoside-diphosphate-sugar epimerase
MHEQRICLIGGSGFIGSYIAERLAEQEASLTIATRNRDRHKASLIVCPRPNWFPPMCITRWPCRNWPGTMR